MLFVFFFSSRRRHTRWPRDWSSDVCSSDLGKSWNVNNFKDKLNPSEKGDNSVVIVPELYEYTINYYRYDDKAMDWDMWIFGDGLEGKRSEERRVGKESKRKREREG